MMKHRPSDLVTTVIVGGPWCSWPQDTWDGTVRFPSRHSMPPEWWSAFWLTQPEPMRPRPNSFLIGYRRLQPWMKETLS